MSTILTVDYDKFISLAELDLASYMEPLVTNPMTMVSKEVLERMLLDFPAYDKYHLVYALTLGASHSPETFGAYLPQYLAHEDGSVCCTALNMLDRLPDEYITQELVDSVRRVVSGYPVREFVVPLPERLTRRLAAKLE